MNYLAYQHQPESLIRWTSRTAGSNSSRLNSCGARDCCALASATKAKVVDHASTAAGRNTMGETRLMSLMGLTRKL